MEKMEGGEVNTVGECRRGGLERSVLWVEMLVHMKKGVLWVEMLVNTARRRMLMMRRVERGRCWLRSATEDVDDEKRGEGGAEDEIAGSQGQEEDVYDKER